MQEEKYTATLTINFLSNRYHAVIYKDGETYNEWVFKTLGGAYTFIHFYIRGAK